jgi:lipoprotein NlpD
VRRYNLLAVSLIYLICLGILGGCVGARVNWDPDDYTVRSGDTLYSIAWRYEIDHGDLARWNHLSSPYIIHPGDRLHTRPSDNLASKPSSESSRDEIRVYGSRRITVRQGDTLYSLAKKHYMPAWKLAMINGIKEPYVLHPGQTLSLKTPVVVSDSSRNATVQTTPVKASQDYTSLAHVAWRWPVRGRIIGKFNSRKNDAKGINIAGNSGVFIRAAAPGKVVYSGNSLINYGHLVIIKHSRDYLSAYANNRKLLVSEGEMVKAGQKIAELGGAETGSPHLHFEIRKKGKPVDPLRYLPSS